MKIEKDELIAAILKVTLGIDYNDIKKITEKFFSKTATFCPFPLQDVFVYAIIFGERWGSFPLRRSRAE